MSVNLTYYQSLVSPAIGAVLQLSSPLTAFITLDLPTLGKPKKPTVIDCYFLVFIYYNCLNTDNSSALPNVFLLVALNAIVGCIYDNICI